MPIFQTRKNVNKPKSKTKAGTKSKPVKKKKGAGKAEVPSKKLDEKVTKNPTGDK